jgi:CDP-diacylglycerol--serine O-phosphatidyltransferase
MNSIKKGLPGFFTSLGLISGCISIVISVSYANLTLAGYFILIAAFFDFIDGWVARALDAVSDFGKQLDSLADVISFGVAPATILYRLMLLSHVNTSPDAGFDVMHPDPPEAVLMFSVFLVAVFSALRLAKFNLDSLQVKNFRGLPTPANALFIAGLGFAAETSRNIPAVDIIFTRWFLLAVILLSCYLLVSNIGMFSLKFSSFGIRNNLMRYLFLLLAAVLIVLFGLPALAPVIVVYVIMSMINTRIVKME